MAEPGMIYLRGNSVTVQDEAGGTVKVSGSPSVNRDISTKQSWWGLRPLREPPPVPVDENGVAYHLCSGGHYRPRRGFDVDTSRKTGLRAYCKECRHQQYLRQSAEAAEKAGKALGRYRDKKAARVNLAQVS